MAWNNIAYLRRQNVTFIKPHMWIVPFGALQKRWYTGRKFENVEQLKLAIVLEWHALSEVH